MSKIHIKIWNYSSYNLIVWV